MSVAGKLIVSRQRMWWNKVSGLNNFVNSIKGFWQTTSVQKKWYKFNICDQYFFMLKLLVSVAAVYAYLLCSRGKELGIQILFFILCFVFVMKKVYFSFRKAAEGTLPLQQISIRYFLVPLKKCFSINNKIFLTGRKNLCIRPIKSPFLPLSKSK